jgi:hypothetical protein
LINVWTLGGKDYRDRLKESQLAFNR